MSHLRGHMLHLLLKIKNDNKKKNLNVIFRVCELIYSQRCGQVERPATLKDLVPSCGILHEKRERTAKNLEGTVASSGHKDVRWTEKSHLDWTVSARSRHVKETLKAKNEFCKSLRGQTGKRCPGIKIRVDGLNEINYKLKNYLYIYAHTHAVKLTEANFQLSPNKRRPWKEAEDDCLLKRGVL